MPWLGPDGAERAVGLSGIGVENLVVGPIGFVAEHMEGVFDLDRELAEICDEHDIQLVRARTAGTHPKFIEMLRELVQERLGLVDRRRSLSSGGPMPDVCAPDCCLYPIRRKGDSTEKTLTPDLLEGHDSGKDTLVE